MDEKITDFYCLAIQFLRDFSSNALLPFITYTHYDFISNTHISTRTTILRKQGPQNFWTFKAQVAKVDRLKTTKFFVKEIAQMTTGTIRNFSKNKKSSSVRIRKFAKIKDHIIGTEILGYYKDH